MSKAVGRPSSFKPEFADHARKLCELAATDEEIAAFFDVSARTIYRWQVNHPEFCHALKVGKAAADDRVERSLFHRAVGYTFEGEKVFQHKGEIVRATVTEHVPPDTTAIIFWLKNRRREDWRDVQDHKHSGHLTLGALLRAGQESRDQKLLPSPKPEGDDD